MTSTPPAEAARRAFLRVVSLPLRPAHDRGPDRPAVVQRLPGKHISGLAGRHRGACAIFFNGESLGDHDLHQVRLPIIGMNRTFVGYEGYRGPQPDYYCWVDFAWMETAKRLASEPGVTVVNGSAHRDNIGYRATRTDRMAPFSFDLARDGYVPPIPCTTGHLALQLAVYLGFTTIYALGLDMGGGHFDGTPASRIISDANAYHRRQARLLEEHGIQAFVTGSPRSRCTAFPHVPFDRLLEAA